MTTPVGGVLALIFTLLVFCLERRKAAVALIAAVCYMTEGYPLDFAGFHFTAIRFVLLAGLVRVAIRGELGRLRLNTIDRSLITFASAVLIISVLRVGTISELVYQTGCLYNVILAYFVFRCFLRDERDYQEVLVKLALAIVPLALLLFLESRTGRDLFATLGAVSEFSMVRDGQLRAEGPFRSPITAGSFGATFAVLYASLLLARIRTGPALLGLVNSVLIVVSSHSSGPLLGFGIGLASLACWYVRRQTGKIRWGIVAGLLGLQLVMKAPVWFLIGRISDVVGGGGYHRAYLIDQFVKHFDSWWLLGTSDTHGWVATELVFGGTDLTNKFVSDGVNAGLVGLILSIVLVVRCFRRIGLAMKANRKLGPQAVKPLWGIGSTLVATIAIFFSVTYFDQTYVIWYFLLACIAGLPVRKEEMVTHESRQEESWVATPA